MSEVPCARTRRAGVDGGDPVRVSGVSDRGGKEGAGGTLTDASRGRRSTRDEPETGGVREGHLNAAHARGNMIGSGPRLAPFGAAVLRHGAGQVCRWWRGGCRFRKKSGEKIGSCDLVGRTTILDRILTSTVTVRGRRDQRARETRRVLSKITAKRSSGFKISIERRFAAALRRSLARLSSLPVRKPSPSHPAPPTPRPHPPPSAI